MNKEIAKNEIRLHNTMGFSKLDVSNKAYRLYLFALMRTDFTKKDFEELYLDIPDILKTTKLSKSNVYERIKELCKELVESSIEIDTIDDGWRLFPVSSECEKIPNIGTIKFVWHQSMKPFLLELRKNYFLTHPSVMTFKQNAPIKLYNLLKPLCYKTDIFAISIPDLKEILGIDINAYPEWGDFNIKIVKKAVNKINKETDLTVTYKGRRKMGKTHTIEFVFHSDRSVMDKIYREYLTYYNFDEMKAKAGIHPHERFTDTEMLILYEIACGKDTDADFDVYKYMNNNYVYMCEQLKDVNDVNRRFGYFKLSLENNYGHKVTLPNWKI